MSRHFYSAFDPFQRRIQPVKMTVGRHAYLVGGIAVLAASSLPSLHAVKLKTTFLSPISDVEEDAHALDTPVQDPVHMVVNGKSDVIGEKSDKSGDPNWDYKTVQDDKTYSKDFPRDDQYAKTEAAVNGEEGPPEEDEKEEEADETDGAEELADEEAPEESEEETPEDKASDAEADAEMEAEAKEAEADDAEEKKQDEEDAKGEASEDEKGDEKEPEADPEAEGEEAAEESEKSDEEEVADMDAEADKAEEDASEEAEEAPAEAPAEGPGYEMPASTAAPVEAAGEAETPDPPVKISAEDNAANFP